MEFRAIPGGVKAKGESGYTFTIKGRFSDDGFAFVMSVSQGITKIYEESFQDNKAFDTCFDLVKQYAHIIDMNLAKPDSRRDYAESMLAFYVEMFRNKYGREMAGLPDAG